MAGDESIADRLAIALIAQVQIDDTLFEGAVESMLFPLLLFHDWYEFGAIRGLVRLLSRMLFGYELAAARNADTYMTRALSVIYGKRVDHTGTRNTDLGRGEIDNADVLERVPAAYRFAVAEQEKVFDKGILLQSPEDAARERLKKIVGTNVQLAVRNQLQQTMKANGITRWRRIIHPELAREGTCGLCIAAADRVYHIGTLMPIHPGCHCTVLPIVGDRDPGLILNEKDFRTIYSTAGSTNAEDLRKTRFRVDQHSEIGPVLRPAGEPIRTAQEAGKALKPGRRLDDRKSPKRAADQRTTLQNKYDKLSGRLERTKQKIAAGTTVPSSDWNEIIARMEGRVSDLKRELAEL